MAQNRRWEINGRPGGISKIRESPFGLGKRKPITALEEVGGGLGTVLFQESVRAVLSGERQVLT